MNKEKLWQKVVDFHGHVCPGVTIGFRAALYAADLLDLKFSTDEEVVCISENDACGLDAIQVILGCTLGKGNLLFHMTGKAAYSFYNRTTGKSVRLVLKKLDRPMTREESFNFFHNCQPEEMFDLKETTIDLPEPARIFESYSCQACGERTSENFIRLEKGKKLCLDCYSAYKRFDI
ncbi:MAG: FmdE family protein [Bacillota bacterium]|nr:FmdE family protein [Bacillota bacterium]